MSRSSLQRARAQGRAEERAAVVAWLRQEARAFNKAGAPGYIVHGAANGIEAREHLDEEGRK